MNTLIIISSIIVYVFMTGFSAGVLSKMFGDTDAWAGALVWPVVLPCYLGWKIAKDIKNKKHKIEDTL